MRSSPEQRWVVDRIEEERAAVEVDGERVVTVPVWLLPRGVREGDVLRVRREYEAGRAVLTVETDDAEQGRRMARSAAQTEGVRAKSRKHDRPGDVTL